MTLSPAAARFRERAVGRWEVEGDVYVVSKTPEGGLAARPEGFPRGPDVGAARVISRGRMLPDPE